MRRIHVHGHRSVAQVSPCLQHERRQHVRLPAGSPEPGVRGGLVWVWQWFWFILMRNRFVIAAASLIWLVCRSGAQPRRLTYPCQQAAAANLGVFAVLFVPGVARRLRRRPDGGRFRRAAHLATAGGALVAISFIAISGGRAVYSELTGGDAFAPIPAREAAAVSATVGIAQNEQSPASLAEIKEMVREAVDLAGGLGQVINPGDTVVLKPNLVQTVWTGDEGVVTNWRVMAAVVDLAKEAGASQVSLAEGTGAQLSGDGPRGITFTAFRDAGYDVNQDHYFDYDPTVPLYDLNDSGGTDVKDPNKVTLVNVPNGVLRTQYWVPNILLNADVMINVPTFKNHFNGTVTLSLKNRVGCAPNDIYHMPGWVNLKWALVHATDKGFPATVAPAPTGGENEIVQRTLVDLNLVRPHDFVVVDGLIGVTNGPNAQPVQNPSPYMRMIVAGADSLAVDTVCTLAMGYVPDNVPQLMWADSTGALGTKDRSVISVLGDRVSLVRYNFPAGYGGTTPAVRSEEIPPVLASTSLQEGDLMTEGETVTGSGLADNTGIVRAELAVQLLGDTLLTNGGFEAGSTGWTQWRASWGANEAWNYSSTEPGHVGNACLKLGSGSTTSSFGVYQEVAVEPGKTYRLDCYWRGQKLGTLNWFEVLLLDGAWDPLNADSGSPASLYVEPNYMYAYDNNTYGLPGAVGTTFGWIHGHDQYAPPKNQVDWNNRQGRRKATGSVMTVVLKAGSTSPGVACWFDEVSLVEVQGQYVVDSVPLPSDPFTLTWDSSRVPIGTYPAEARVTVFDAALNEDGFYRDITATSIPPFPWIQVSPDQFAATVFVGDPVPDESFDVWNAGEGTMNYTVTPDVGWLGAAPGAGSSSGEAHTHVLGIGSEALPPGVNVGTVTVYSPDASNVERQVTVTITVETVSPDFDLDGDVDMGDFGMYQRCLSGPGQHPAAGCEYADLDGDNDVDLNDFGILQGCMVGSGLIPERTCAD